MKSFLVMMTIICSLYCAENRASVSSDDEVVIVFRRDITKSSVNSLIKELDELVSKNKESRREIVISLSSMGGDIYQAERLIEHINDYNKDPSISIDTKVPRYARCASACTIIFTAGKRRLAHKNASFGFHSPQFQSGNQNGHSQAELVQIARNLWLRYINKVDLTVGSKIDNEKYLFSDKMIYLFGKYLTTGFVTELIEK